MSVDEDQPVFVLVRPQLGENVGAAARAMRNFGLTRLRLVAPECGWPNAKAVVAASGAHDVLGRTEVFSTLADAIGDREYLFATTARPRDLSIPVLTPEAAAQEMRRLARAGRRVGVLFGPERTGLENEELLVAQALVTIPTAPDFASLNLAQAVLVAAYAWFRARDDTPPRVDPAEAEPPATRAELTGLVEQLLADLDAVDFFKSPDRRASLAPVIAVSLTRRGLTRSEVHLWRGILKELARGRQRGKAAD
ncbi:MAG: RNA methyltransferase [Geminicoccaceae bacterium]|nr:RNA methyltransferase [Geminicoccaceae bacterium]